MYQVKHTGADIIRMLQKYHQPFEYVGGYSHSDGFVELRCMWCGEITRKTVQSIRKGRQLLCDHCRQGKEWDKLQKDIEAISKQFEDYKRAERSKVKRPSHLKECSVCGKPFWTHSTRAVCCSKECVKRRLNKNADDRLNKQNVIDRDITLDKVYLRDNGKCYLCGGDCDWNDYRTQNGTIIAGDHYPSIDHVVPLSKGGKHEWGNVRLAHRLCNTKKGAKQTAPMSEMA